MGVTGIVDSHWIVLRMWLCVLVELGIRLRKNEILWASRQFDIIQLAVSKSVWYGLLVELIGFLGQWVFGCRLLCLQAERRISLPHFRKPKICWPGLVCLGK